MDIYTVMQQAWFSIMYSAPRIPGILVKTLPPRGDKMEMLLPIGVARYIIFTATSLPDSQSIKLVFETYRGNLLLDVKPFILGDKYTTSLQSLMIDGEFIYNDRGHPTMELKDVIIGLIGGAFAIYRNDAADKAAAVDKLDTPPTDVTHAEKMTLVIERLTKALSGSGITNQLPANLVYDLDAGNSVYAQDNNHICWYAKSGPLKHTPVYSITRPSSGYKDAPNYHIVSSDGKVDVTIDAKLTGPLGTIHLIADELFQLHNSNYGSEA